MKGFCPPANRASRRRSLRYPGLTMDPSREATDTVATPSVAGVRDPLVDIKAVLAARRRPMSERLELALSWNALAAELRLGLLAVGRAKSGR